MTVDDKRKVLLLGLGNAILCDDGVGIHAVRAIEPDARSAGIEVREAEVAGFQLLDLLTGFDAVIVVDAARLEGARPGDVHVLAAHELPASLHLVAAHQIDLASALALGRELGMPMPADVRIVAVHVEDDRTFSETCTPAVAKAIGTAGATALQLALSFL